MLSQYTFEIIVNDNFSSDNSFALLSDWAQADNRVVLQQFKRNIGFQQSIIMGMRAASGDAVIVVQSDLQDPVELIEEFINSWATGSKVVAGVISSRSESLISRTTRKLFYYLLKIVSDKEVEMNFQDFYLLDKSVYENIKSINLNNAFIRAQITSEYGIDHKILYERHERKFGVSKFDFPAKYSLAVDALLLYGNRIPRLLSLLSIAMSFSFFILTCCLLVSKIIGVNFVSRGWLSLVSLNLLGFSLVFFIFSFLMEYLLRIYKLQLNSEK